MNEDARWFRIVPAGLFLTLAAVLLLFRFVYRGVPSPELWSWIAVVGAGLLGIALLPLNDGVDRGVHQVATVLGCVTLFIWLGNVLLTPSTTGLTIIVLAGVVVVTRSIARQRWSEAANELPPRPAMTARLRVVGIIAAITIASFFYRWLMLHRLEQTSALFIGIPALLAILMTLFSRPRSATGMICMVMAIALLVSGIFLGEGFVCILMASPIFFLIAVIVGSMTDWARKRNQRSQTTLSCLLFLILTPMSFEGTRAALSFPRDEVIYREVVVNASAAEVATRVGATPKFPAELPAFLRLGFPRPTETSGSGTGVGGTRKIHFAGGEGKPGDLVFEIVSADEHTMEFRAVSDTSHVAHWLKWQTTRFDWTSLPDGQTRVTCTVRYRRLLDPAWYFKPWERYAVALSTDYLLRSMTATEGH
jgi:hypothetical protein